MKTDPKEEEGVITKVSGFVRHEGDFLSTHCPLMLASARAHFSTLCAEILPL
jgi:hypothetical protein